MQTYLFYILVLPFAASNTEGNATVKLGISNAVPLEDQNIGFNAGFACNTELGRDVWANAGEHKKYGHLINWSNWTDIVSTGVGGSWC